MKAFIFPLLLTWFWVPSALFAETPPAGVPSAQALIDEGIDAYQRKDWQTAVDKLQLAFSKTSRPHPRAVYYLKNAQLNLKQGVPKETLEQKLKAIIIPSVEFDEASLQTVFDFLSQKVGSAENSVTLNFIYRGSSTQRHLSQVTLKLSNVPVYDVLRYVGQLTQTKFDYQPYAVVASPLIPEAVAPPPTRQAELDTF